MNHSDAQGLCRAAGAATASGLRFRVGAWCGGAYGWNSNKRHPALARLGFSAYNNRHAELDLVLRTDKDLKRETFYVARLLRNGEWALARPCRFCMAVLCDLGVKRVVWTTGPRAGEGMKL